MSTSDRVSKAAQGIVDNLNKDIEKAAGEPVAFILVMFTEGRSTYISTCAEKDEAVYGLEKVVEGMKQEYSIPAHKLN